MSLLNKRRIRNEQISSRREWFGLDETFLDRHWPGPRIVWLARALTVGVLDGFDRESASGSGQGQGDARRPYTGLVRTEADMTAKETVRALLDRLPDDCSLDDVLYHLYVVQAVGQGIADADAGRVIPHDEVAAELRRKWLLGSAQ